MKRVFLTLLMVVMLATPCMAEVEPDSLFSIERTLWQRSVIVDFPRDGLPQDEIGFYQGTVYNCFGDTNYECRNLYPYIIFDSPVVSIAFFFGTAGPSFYTSLLIMQPIGFGLSFDFIGMITPPMIVYARMGIMLKTDDNWTPPTTTTTI